MGTTGYFQRREGVALRKSIRGCIVGLDLGALNLVLVSKGEGEIEKLTDVTVPRKLGPKRANKIRKLFGLEKHSDNIGVKNATKKNIFAMDVCKAVVRRVVKAPKIQRLITAQRIYRKTSRRTQKYEKARQSAEQVAAFNKREQAKLNAAK